MNGLLAVALVGMLALGGGQGLADPEPTPTVTVTPTPTADPPTAVVDDPPADTAVTPAVTPTPTPTLVDCPQATDKGGYCHNWIVPEPPVWVDECGPGNGHWVIPSEAVGGKYKTYTLAGKQWAVFVPNLHDEYLVKPGSTLVWWERETNTEPCEVPVPALFSTAVPAPPDCDSPGALPNISDPFPNVELSFDRPFDGPGEYTLTATALNGYEFEGGGTVRERTITVLGATGFQSEDPTAPCFFANEVEVTPTADYSPPSCTNGGTITLGEDPGYEWTAVANEDGTYTYTAVPSEGYIFPEGAQTQWTADLGPALPADSEECEEEPTPPTPVDPDEPELAATGSDMSPVIPLGALATIMAGLSLFFFRRWEMSKHL